MDILEIASQLARTMYTKEFCSLCGKAITIEDATALVSAKSNDNKVLRSAHKDCMQRPISEKTWKYAHNR